MKLTAPQELDSYYEASTQAVSRNWRGRGDASRTCMLSEIADYRRHVCRVEVSQATIYRTLCRCGFSRKKVYFFIDPNARFIQQ
ncbi:hypothetical protein CPB83DRAFT_863622 [Crepidotus variabilis]|uniref:Uncharacterized protein n=1 Tax=Crepidotus variabilis TaxID=179855 RepID=A0A9P6E5U9_9AGAR|nr:hypothetical protein CPB83DRAFT_863622 [Crepidotus variabilis]